MSEYGARVRRLELPGLVLTESRRPPRLFVPKHAHRHTNVSLVVKGTFLETVGGVPRLCRPGSVVFRPGGEAHENRYGDTEARSLIVEVLPERLATLREAAPVLDRSLHLASLATRVLAARAGAELRRFDDLSPLAIESLLLEVLVLAARSEKRTSSGAPGWLLRARDLVHDRFREPLGLSAIAAEVGVHPAHLAKAFRRHFRSTLGEYARKLRLDRALRELLASDRPIAEIAIACGFCDQSHLTHSTKLHLGATPGELRRAARSGKARTN